MKLYLDNKLKGEVKVYPKYHQRFFNAKKSSTKDKWSFLIQLDALKQLNLPFKDYYCHIGTQEIRLLTSKEELTLVTRKIDLTND